METFTPRSRSGRESKSTCDDSLDPSDDSVPSVILPKSRKCRAPEKSGLVGQLSDKEIYHVLNLYIFFSVVIQVVTAVGMICVGVVFITLNYRNGLLGDFQVNLSLYLFEASGMLFLIGSYMCALNHNFYPIPVVKHLKTSALVLSFNMICLITVISWGLKTAIELRAKTLKKFKKLFHDFNRSDKAHSFLIDVQNKFDCCGVSNEKDWKSSNLELPTSCCSNFSIEGTCQEWKTRGCYEVYYIKTYSFVHYVIGFGSVALGIAIIALIPTVVAASYARKNKKLVSSLNKRSELVVYLNSDRDRSQEIVKGGLPLEVNQSHSETMETSQSTDSARVQSPASLNT